MTLTDNIVVVAPGEGGTAVAVVPRAATMIEAKRSHTGEPYDDVSFESTAATAVAATALTPDRAGELAALGHGSTR